ncbi:hypothetical protein SAMN05421493_1042 [Pseudobutyrivibrio sp. 49]|nr:hypothetical protein SAMN05421493_1042 [Pseudobutyrivibrio sp. 49]
MSPTVIVILYFRALGLSKSSQSVDKEDAAKPSFAASFPLF